MGVHCDAQPASVRCSHAVHEGDRIGETSARDHVITRALRVDPRSSDDSGKSPRSATLRPVLACYSTPNRLIP